MESRTERAKRFRSEASKYAELVRAGPPDIMSDVHRRLAERYIRMAQDLERRENLKNSLVTFLNRQGQ
jgi:hypothetical protein